MVRYPARQKLQLLGWMLCCLLPISCACLEEESMGTDVCSSHIWNALKSPCTLNSACQGTQGTLNGQLPTAAPLTTSCELIPQHLRATSPGTLQLQRRCQEADQMQQEPLRTAELHGHAGLSRDSAEAGCFVTFASSFVSPSLAVLLCTLAHCGFKGGRKSHLFPTCCSCCLKFLLGCAGLELVL